jgi:hypothetical protein
MSYSYTQSETKTFTITHAKHMAAKVATDLKRMQRFYGFPSDADINKYEGEAIELLKKGYLGTVAYGFKRNGDWIEPMLKYSARDFVGDFSNDDDPGRIKPNADISGASFYSYLTYSASWNSLLDDEKQSFSESLPLFRNGADEPGVNGYLESDKVYSSGGKALDRSSLRSY